MSFIVPWCMKQTLQIEPNAAQVLSKVRSTFRRPEDSNFQIKEKSYYKLNKNKHTLEMIFPGRNVPINILKITSVPSFPSPLPCIYGYGPQPQPCILASFRFAGACLL
jgi:hypothetical protein